MYNVYNFFPTQVYRSELPGWVNQTNLLTQKYYNEAYLEQRNNRVIQTYDLSSETELDFIRDHFYKESLHFLDMQGYQTCSHLFFVREMWGQEFNDGGSNFPHVHPGCQTSGLYFFDIKPADNIRVEINLYDTRVSKSMVELPLKNTDSLLSATNTVLLDAPLNGTFLIFNSWLTHSITVVNTVVKFLHFNLGYEFKK
jgi:uncharacterized protein (TIGR02466 family)